MIIVLGDGSVARMMREHFNKEVLNVSNTLPTDNDKIKAVVFTGGTDVSPLYYGQDKLPITGASDKARDANESLWFSWCRNHSIPMIGICRGAQFGCVMSGGELYQHVEGHGIEGTHAMDTEEGKTMEVTSTHHQMMAPDFTNHELIGWSTVPLSKIYLHDKVRSSIAAKPDVEAEVVYFNDTKFLGFQYHPEYMTSRDDAVKYFVRTIKAYFPEIEE